MGLKENAAFFRAKISSTFSFENLVLMLTVGLVLLQVIAYVGTTWFDWEQRFFGPYLLLVIIAAIMMVVFLFLRRGHNFSAMSRFDWALLIISAVIMIAAIMIFRNSPFVTPALFKPAATNLASVVGVG